MKVRGMSEAEWSRRMQRVEDHLALLKAVHAGLARVTVYKVRSYTVRRHTVGAHERTIIRLKKGATK